MAQTEGPRGLVKAWVPRGLERFCAAGSNHPWEPGALWAPPAACWGANANREDSVSEFVAHSTFSFQNAPTSVSTQPIRAEGPRPHKVPSRGWWH